VNSESENKETAGGNSGNKEGKGTVSFENGDRGGEGEAPKRFFLNL
jgi:hypothetical protein